MSIIENLTKKVTETARVAAKKSSDLVEVTKLNMCIGTEEGKIEKVYTEIGKLVYESYTNGESVSETFKEYCDRIRSYEENILQMKEKINELKNLKICPSCNAELEIEVAFCSKCGTKQEIPQPPVEEPKEKVCNACGASNTLDAAFCSKCGTRI